MMAVYLVCNLVVWKVSWMAEKKVVSKVEMTVALWVFSMVVLWVVLLVGSKAVVTVDNWVDSMVQLKVVW